ncbi:MAG: type II toxin-antitoxin system RelE/ParE family toxin [Pyrinomonadaceae bacterium]
MARVVIWSERAVRDIEAIAEYIAQDSEAYASSVVRTILQKSRLLTGFPFIGRIVPEFADESIREIFAYSYRIIYKINEEEIRVATVIHGRRELDISHKP